MNSPIRVVVTGLIGQHPLLGGVAWDPLGLARLGQGYLEDSGEWLYKLDGGRLIVSDGALPGVASIFRCRIAAGKRAAR